MLDEAQSARPAVQTVRRARLDTPRRVGLWAVEVYLRPVAALLMLRAPWLALGPWIALAFHPALAAMALAAATLSEALGRVIGRYMPGRFGLAERMNTFLVGLVSAWLLLPLEPSVPFMLAFTLFAQMLVVLVSLVLSEALRRPGLPVLILPYAAVATVLFTLMPVGVHHAVVSFDWPVMASPGWAEVPVTFLTAMGVVVLSPSVVSGLLVLAVIALNAPLGLVAGLLGWLGGMVLAQGLLVLGIPFAWEVTAYNYVLAGIAAGTAFFVPGRPSLMLAPLAGGLAALLAAFIQNFLAVPGLAILPIPFGLTVLLLLSALAAGPFRPDPDWQVSPALKWLRSSWRAARWGPPQEPLLAVPVSGPVRITQGFGGVISHRAAWRHALDFERPGPAPDAPSLWGETVRAPIRGQVVDTRDDVPDNVLGVANHAENWGNHVLIRHDEQCHVMLAHLMPGTIAVAPGQRVGFATRIGQVGNSGRSYVPHLHLHVQREGYPGAPTAPFRLANYLQLDPAEGRPRRWRAQGVPGQGDMIQAATPVAAVHDTLSSILSGRTIWTVEAEGDAPGWLRQRQPVVSTTEITEAGGCRIASGGEHLLARFDVDGWRVIELQAAPGSLVATLASAMATVPWCAVPDLEWADTLPRAWPRAMAMPVEALLPFARVRLQRLGLRCVAIPGAGGTGLTLRAVPARGGPFGADRCEATVEPVRGPVSAVWTGPGYRLSYAAMSFTVASA